MPRYLVVAHQTAASEELLRRITGLRAADTSSTFALLVPATHPTDLFSVGDGTHLLTWDESEARASAELRLRDAGTLLGDAGVRVIHSAIGDHSPLLAVEDELRENPDSYDVIVLSTLPPGKSRWLRMNVREHAERKLRLPVLHVFEGGADAWRESLERMRVFDDDSGGSSDAQESRAGLRLRGVSVELPLILAAIGLYLVLMAAMAIAVDRRFFVNDAIAIVVFTGFVIGVLVSERGTSGGATSSAAPRDSKLSPES